MREEKMKFVNSGQMASAKRVSAADDRQVYCHASRMTHYASRFTHHASRITHYFSRSAFQASRFTFHVSRFTLHVSMLCCMSTFAGPGVIDETKLPPAASVKADYERDIKPIFEASCWRCHGPERPQESFSAVITGESALKGGETESIFCRVTAPVVRSFIMLRGCAAIWKCPPPGKGQPLTAEQVGLLRAWIESKGVPVGVTNPPVQFAFSAAPTLRWINVQGDKSKFR